MPIRRVVLIAIVVSLWAIPKAEASPFLTTWSGTFHQGPLVGTAFDFTFVFETLPFDPVFDPLKIVPCCGPGFSKLLYVSVNLAGTQIYSALNPVGQWLVAGGVFGPAGFQVPVHALPPGLMSWSVGVDPTAFYTYVGGPQGQIFMSDVREGPVVPYRREAFPNRPVFSSDLGALARLR
jgi:hypothetical protein